MKIEAGNSSETLFMAYWTSLALAAEDRNIRSIHVVASFSDQYFRIFSFCPDEGSKMLILNVH
jgi:hypothetical protein